MPVLAKHYANCLYTKTGVLILEQPRSIDEPDYSFIASTEQEAIDHIYHGNPSWPQPPLHLAFRLYDAETNKEIT